MTIHECPCGEDYQYHLGLIWQIIAAKNQQADYFVTLDPFILANEAMFAEHFGVRVRKPSELVSELKGEAWKSSPA